MSKISIIIVNYNSGLYLRNCLQSIIVSLINVNFEIIVVDNNSTDDSIDRCKREFETPLIKFIQSGENLGFSRANNLGVKYATGDMYHFLNPDTEVDSSLIESYNIATSDNSIVYSTRLKNPDGTIINLGYTLPIFSQYLKRIFHLPYSKWYLGASVLMSSDIFNQIGGWNESYFMYSEDLDLFYKIYLAKIDIRLLPSVIFHAGGACANNTWSNQKRQSIIKDSENKFYEINGIKWQIPIIHFLQKIYSYFRRN